MNHAKKSKGEKAKCNRENVEREGDKDLKSEESVKDKLINKEAPNVHKSFLSRGPAAGGGCNPLSWKLTSKKK